MVLSYKRKLGRNRFDRISVLAIVFFVFISIIIFKLFNLQVVQGSFYEALAAGNHTVYRELLPIRGEIFSSDTKQNTAERIEHPAALNVELNEVYAAPQYIKNPQKTSEALAVILGLDAKELEIKLSKQNDPYERIFSYLSDEKVEEIKKLALSGVNFRPEQKRFYPEKNLFSQVIGFVGYVGDKRVGQYGIEEYFERELAGRNGEITLEKGGLGNWITTSGRIMKRAENGAKIVLTLDRSIQFMACDELKQGVIDHQAKSGNVIIINAKTGAILSLCGYPDFEPNNYSQVENIEVFANQAVSHPYEPGSVFKVITMAIGLDRGSVRSETTYEDTGEVRFGPDVIRNSDEKAHGKVTMTGILENSLNTGAIFVARKVGKQSFKDYLNNFGFGAVTGIELPSEAKGDFSALDKNEEIYLATASFGQGITATPIQMITAFTPITAEGKLLKPYLVARIERDDGRIVTTEPEAVRQVISPMTAKTLSAMLVSVVKNGHAKRAAIPGYYVGGKSGTAQVPKTAGSGYSDLTIHTFVGFAPADDPAFIALVKIDYPQTARFAESTVVPIFAKIAKFVLDYYQIPPNE